MKSFVLAPFLAIALMVTLTSCSDRNSLTNYDTNYSAPSVKNPDDYIRKQMESHWSNSERMTWRIQYKKIDGLANSAQWHIQGTEWWVRLYPDFQQKYIDLHKSTIFEIDAISLNQEYGVISFYVYGIKRIG